jgi:hypothetical protein
MNRLCIGLLVAASGCSCEKYENAECGVAASDDIDGFRITTTTGSDESDADIYFCVRTKAGSESCEQLSEFLNDNFQEGAIEEFEVDIEVDAGDLDSFRIENRGGGDFTPDPVGDIVSPGNDWDLAGLKVEADVDGSYILLYRETDICGGYLDAGDSYTPMSCTY